MVNLKHMVSERSQDAIHMKHPEKVNLYRPIAEGGSLGLGEEEGEGAALGYRGSLGGMKCFRT